MPIPIAGAGAIRRLGSAAMGIEPTWYQIGPTGDVFLPLLSPRIVGRLTGPFGRDVSSYEQMSWSMRCSIEGHKGCRLVKTVRQLKGEEKNLVLWLLAGLTLADAADADGRTLAQKHKDLWATVASNI